MIKCPEKREHKENCYGKAVNNTYLHCTCGATAHNEAIDACKKAHDEAQCKPPNGGYFGTHCHICHEAVGACGCVKAHGEKEGIKITNADTFDSGMKKLREFTIKKYGNDTSQDCKEAHGKGLVPLDEPKLSANLSQFNIEFNGKSPNFQWCNFMAKRVCEVFVTSPRDIPTVEELYIELCVECGNEERGDLLNSKEKELELMRYAQAIHARISGGENERD